MLKLRTAKDLGLRSAFYPYTTPPLILPSGRSAEMQLFMTFCVVPTSEEQELIRFFVEKGTGGIWENDTWVVGGGIRETG